MKTFLIILTLALTACGGAGDDGDSTPETSQSSSVEVPKYHVDPEPTVAPAKPNCQTTYPC